jgi:hypothetical protein
MPSSNSFQMISTTGIVKGKDYLNLLQIYCIILARMELSRKLMACFSQYVAFLSWISDINGVTKDVDNCEKACKYIECNEFHGFHFCSSRRVNPGIFVIRIRPMLSRGARQEPKERLAALRGASRLRVPKTKHRDLRRGVLILKTACFASAFILYISHHFSSISCSVTSPRYSFTSSR